MRLFAKRKRRDPYDNMKVMVMYNIYLCDMMTAMTYL